MNSPQSVIEYFIEIIGIFANPLNKKAGIKLSNSKDTFNGITDKKLALSFSNGYGFYSMIKTSNNAGNLHVSRETSGMEG